MKKRIPFDISHKEEIINGKYTVETRNGEPVEIVLWNWGWPYEILGRIGKDGTPRIWTSKGTVDLVNGNKSDDDLFVVTSVNVFDEFENELLENVERMRKNKEYYKYFDEGQKEFKEFANKVLESAKKKLVVPKWKTSGDGISGNGDYEHPSFLVRTSYGHYFLTSCLSPNIEYLDLEDLESLPHEN